MFARLADVSIRRRRLILVVALVAFVVCGAIGGGVAGRLSSGGFDDPGAPSTQVQHLLEDRFDTGTPNIVLLVTAGDGSVDSPAVAAAGKALARELGAETSGGQQMTEVLSHWDLPADNPLADDAGDKAMVLGRFPDVDNALVDLSSDIAERYTRDDPGSAVTVRVGGYGPVFAEINKTIEHDLVRAELIAIPITLLLLLVIFRGVVAALLPLSIGALSVVGTFLVLYLVNEVTEVSVFALNLTTAMGLGLAIDYSLFIVSRYREELLHHEPDVAIRRTVQTAGRTVLFSALTVAASLCALLVFDISFLRSFAYAGLAVAALAGIYAVVLPAMLAALGHRIDALSLRRKPLDPETSAHGFWHRMAVTVMRRPVPITLVIVTFLVVIGSPTAGMKLGFPDDRVLPTGKSARDVQDVLRTNFRSAEAGAAPVVATGTGSPASRVDAVTTYAERLAEVGGVARVDSEVGIFCGSAGAVGGVDCRPGDLVLPASASPDLVERFSRPDATYLSVVPDVEPVGCG